MKISEIPTAEGIIGEKYSKSLDELIHAQEYFAKGEYDKAVGHCRSAIEPIKKNLSKLRASIESDTEDGWVKKIRRVTGNSVLQVPIREQE